MPNREGHPQWGHHEAILIFAKVLAQGRSLTVAALLVGSTVRSQQSRDRQGALRDPNLQILLQKWMAVWASVRRSFPDLEIIEQDPRVRRAFEQDLDIV
jgi:hypothetical protein